MKIAMMVAFEGEFWGINIEQPTEFIAYHHNMGDQYEFVGSSILEVWRADYSL